MSLLCQSSIRDGTIASIKEDFPSQGEKRKPLSSESLRTIINWDLFATLAGFWEDSAMDNINEEYDRLVEHLHGFTRKAESFKTIKRRLSLETHELIRQHGAARTTVNQELTSKLARLCRAAIKEELSERPEEVLAEKKRSPCPPRNRKLQDKDVCSTEHEWSNDYIKKWNGENHPQLLQSFDTHVNLPSHHLREDGNVLPEVLPCELRDAIMSVKNRTAPGSDRIRSEHLKNLPPVLINIRARLFTRCLSECKIPKQWNTSKIVLLYKKGDLHDIGNYSLIVLIFISCTRSC
ncbi:hypothetical protein RB195_024906 [Necator americanus]|uniref:Reverse transcriptase domain-containing protein n=1 Tax=Necator americanus TaxID=51031 RepID=A0ABR1EQ40_NECAM